MPPGKILIIKLSAIGDVIMATPVIKVLRREYPDSHIAWLVEEASQDIVKDNPLLDEVIVWKKQEWKRLLKKGMVLSLIRQACSFSRKLRARRFDLVLDLQGFLKSGIMAYLSGAPERIGPISKEHSHILMTKAVQWRKGGRISGQYMDMVKALGLEPGDFHMEIHLTKEDQEFAKSFVSQLGAYAVLCPFSSVAQKNWIEERWAELARGISARAEMKAILLGGKGDMEISRRIESAACGAVINLTGKTTLKQAFAVISNARVMAGVDTGLTHAGIAFNVPAAAIFGSTCPYVDTGGDNAIILYKKMACSPCRRRPVCGGDFKCLKAISTEEVLQNMLKLSGGS